jgi:hypothetical protein
MRVIDQAKIQLVLALDKVIFYATLVALVSNCLIHPGLLFVNRGQGA